MAYQKQTWNDLPNTTTPVTANRMNHIEDGVANAVVRTGDTVTGELNFNNKNDFTAIRKTRTIDNTDYELRLGVGGNKSTSLELYTGSTNLSRLDLRSDGGIYNGKTGNKLPEIVHLTWGTSLVFNMTVGHHALVMIDYTDCVLIWLAGSASSPSMNIGTIYGNSINVTNNGTTVTVTKKSGGSNFTGTAILT